MENPGLPVVLVVDDEADVRGVFAKMLEFGGYSPVEAGTGEEALELLGNGPLPDAVLLDLRMPGMGGLGFLSRLRQHPQGARIPVAIITGDSFIDDRLERAILALGASIHFKPINIDEILALTTALVSPAPGRRACRGAP